MDKDIFDALFAAYGDLALGGLGLAGAATVVARVQGIAVKELVWKVVIKVVSLFPQFISGLAKGFTDSSSGTMLKLHQKDIGELRTMLVALADDVGALRETIDRMVVMHKTQDDIKAESDGFSALIMNLGVAYIAKYSLTHPLKTIIFSLVDEAARYFPNLMTVHGLDIDSGLIEHRIVQRIDRLLQQIPLFEDKAAGGLLVSKVHYSLLNTTANFAVDLSTYIRDTNTIEENKKEYQRMVVDFVTSLIRLFISSYTETEEGKR